MKTTVAVLAAVALGVALGVVGVQYGFLPTSDPILSF